MKRWIACVLASCFSVLALADSGVKLTVRSTTSLKKNDSLKVVTKKSKGFVLAGQATATSVRLFPAAVAGTGGAGDDYVVQRDKDGSNVSYASSSNSGDDGANLFSTNPATCSSGTVNFFGGTACGNPFPPYSFCTGVLMDATSGTELSTNTSLYSQAPVTYGSGTSGHTYTLTVSKNSDPNIIGQKSVTCP